MNLTTPLAFLLMMTLTSLAFARHDGSYLHRMSMEYQTPHQSWATPLPGGPIKALVISPRAMAARETVELAQRLEMDWRAVAIFREDMIAMDSIYEAAVTGTGQQEKTEELLAELRKPAEVIVLSNVVLAKLPSEAQYRILQHVADGGGLVITYARKNGFSKLYQKPTQDNQAIIAPISPQALTPALRAKPMKDWVKTYAVGKGRLVEITYPTASSAHYGGLGLTYDIPETAAAWFPRYEANMALVARAVLWAAGRSERVTVELPTLAVSSVLAQQSLAEHPLKLTVRSGDVSRGTLTLRLRAADNDLLWSVSQPVTLQDGQADLSFTLPAVRAGEHALDVVFTSDKGVETIGCHSLRVLSPLGSAEVKTERETYEAGQGVDVTMTLAKPPATRDTLQVRLKLMDSPYGQVWEQVKLPWPAGEGSLKATLPVRGMPTLAGRLVAEFWLDGVMVDRQGRDVFFPQRHRPIYTEYLWGGLAQQLPPLMAHQAIDKAGWHAGLTHPVKAGANARMMAIYDQAIIPYMTRIGIGGDKEGRTRNNHWLGLSKKDIDEAGIEDDQSFYNPKIQELWKKSIDRRIEGLPTYGPLVYNLGDENYVGYNAGYSPSDLPAFRQYLARRYGSVDKLNQQWQSAYASFDEVEHLPMDQVRQGKHFSRWLDHRGYLEQQYADVHHFLARYIRSIDPHAQVGAEGSVPGDLEKTIEGLEFWGPYSHPIYDELLRCIGGDRLRTLWWGGYTGSHGGRKPFATALWVPMVQGVINGSAWYSGSVGTDGFLGIDLTFADYYKTLMPQLESLRRGMAQLLITQPLRHDGVAILYSHASQSVSLMDARLFTPADSAGPLMRYFYRAGINFDFVTSPMVEKGALASGKYRVLLLTGASALSEAEAQAIRQFAQDGGLVIADINPGVLNEYAGKLKESSLAAFFGVPGMNWEPELALDAVKVDATLRGRRIAFNAAKAWRSPGLPTFQVTPHGQGAAVLLNFNLGSAQNSASDDHAFTSLLDELMAGGGVTPAVRVELDGVDGRRLPNLLVRVRESAGVRNLAVVADMDAVGKKLTLHFDKPVHAFVVDGRPLGHGSTFTLTMDSPALLVGAFDERPAPPALTIDNEAIKPGGDVKWSLDALDGAGVYRLEVLAPDGTRLDRRTRVFTRQQPQGASHVAFAFNDEPGVYTLRLTDVRSNLSTEKKVKVLP